MQEIQSTIPMNRLVQGDVGSGKTMVALFASLQVAKNGFQSIIMAPTQVLANQHYLTFKKYLEPLGIIPSLITASNKKREDSLVLIGTHALLHDKKIIQNDKLGLLVIDEQHRFGVLQRSKFLQSSHVPHILTMSATPIPRTVALSFYGHLQISDIKTMPKDRKETKTWVVPENKRDDSYQWIKEKIKEDNQAYIVCPFIEVSEAENLKNVKAATIEYERLQKDVFPDLKLVLLHGKLKSEQKDEILKRFKDREFDILVTTPVIEVGVDIPTANIILVEDASRFGLSQLHQLRGRVGRGTKPGFCLLFCPKESDSFTRLKLMEKYNKGLDLAKLDLKLRGAGDVFGTAQTGHLDTQFETFWNKELNSKAKLISDMIFKEDQNKLEEILQSLNFHLANYVSAN